MAIAPSGPTSPSRSTRCTSGAPLPRTSWTAYCSATKSRRASTSGSRYKLRQHGQARIRHEADHAEDDCASEHPASPPAAYGRPGGDCRHTEHRTEHEQRHEIREVALRDEGDGQHRSTAIAAAPVDTPHAAATRRRTIATTPHTQATSHTGATTGNDADGPRCRT